MKSYICRILRDINLVVSFSALLLVAGCNDNFMKQKVLNESDPSAVGRTVTKPDGTVVQMASAGYAGTQVVAASGSSTLAGTEVVFPGGSLAISALVSLANGSAMASTSLASGLGMNTTFTNAGVAVTIGSDPAQDTKNPFSLSIPLPATSSLADGTSDGPNVVVIFERYNAKEKTYISGIIGADEIKIVGSVAKFETTNFGTFQSAYTKEKVSASITKSGKAAEVAAAPVKGPHIILVKGNSANGMYYVDDVVTVHVKFSAPVTVSGTTSGLVMGLNCNLGSAIYNSGSGSDTLAFTYTVKATDTCDRLDTGPAPLSLGGAAVANELGIPAVLEVPMKGSSTSLAVLSAISLNGIAPKLKMSGLVQPNGGTVGAVTMSVSKAFTTLKIYSDALCTQAMSTSYSGAAAGDQSIAMIAQQPGSQSPMYAQSKDSTSQYTSACQNLGQTLVTPNPVLSMTASGPERHTFFDGMRHWAFWMTSNGVTYGYSEDGGKTFVAPASNSTFGPYRSRFAVAYKNGVVALAYTNGSGSIMGVRGVTSNGGRSWTWDSAITVLSTNFSRPTVAFGGDDKIYFGGIYSPAGVSPEPKVAGTINTYNSVMSFTSAASVTGGAKLGTSVESMVLVSTSVSVRAFVNVAGGIRHYIFTTNNSAWNQATGATADWTTLGAISGLDNAVTSSLMFKGELYVGGAFGSGADTASPMRGVAKWNGSNWIGLGQSFASNTTINTLAINPSGYLVAGGHSNTTPIVKKFDGVNWANVGGTPFNTGGTVNTLAFDVAGNLYAGGSFSSTAVTNMSGIGKFNGSVWSAMGSGSSTITMVNSIVVQDSGQVLIGGIFSMIRGVGGLSGVATYNGAWTAAGSPCAGGAVASLVYGPSNSIFAACASSGGVSKWDFGSGWTPFGSGTQPTSITSAQYHPSSNSLYVTSSASISVCALPVSGSCTWTALSNNSVTGTIKTMTINSVGRLFIGGAISQVNGFLTSNIYRYDFPDNTANPLSEGFLDQTTGVSIKAVVADTSGNIYVGGHFSHIAGVASLNVAKWNASTGWSAVGSGGIGTANDTVNALAISSGYLYAGGQIASPINNVGKCAIPSCGTWVNAATGLSAYPVTALAVSGTNLFAGTGSGGARMYLSVSGGTFSSFSGWSSGAVTSIATSGGAVAYAGGNDGSQPIVQACVSGACNMVGTLTGGSTVNAVAYDVSNSTLYVGGDFTMAAGLSNTQGIAKYSGAWSAMYSGLGGASPVVTGLSYDSTNSRLFVSGTFSTVNGYTTPGVALWASNNWSPLGSSLGMFGVAAWPGGAYPAVGFGSQGVTVLDQWLVAPRVSSYSASAMGNGVYLAYADERTQTPLTSVFSGSAWSAPVAVGSGPVTGRIFSSASMDGNFKAVLWESNGSIFTHSSRAAGAASLWSSATSPFPNLAETILDPQSFVLAVFSSPPVISGAVMTGIVVP